jgi:hypothetical protein
VERCFLEIGTNAGDNTEESSRNKVNPGILEINMDRYNISVKN